MLIVLIDFELRLPTDGNRPPVSDDAKALAANRTPGDYSTNDGNGTPSMTNVRRSVAGFIGDASAIRPGGLPAMRPYDDTPVGSRIFPMFCS